ncbi:M67 family metallopeptidase [Zavarzinia aquatilis]|uniref:JAB domain-containing protein n=1 Tax=Zavarzinia aquatilis TaxID=2211142 RepID=A0A317EAS9_9PROT|nr:M67 family metallopeptidase [Zavarzinia aquatilis]PWR24227.1 hypothetical protein DKG74_08910 [Zavarzinia aquatilis]
MARALRLSAAALAALRAHAAAEHPREACGFLLGPAAEGLPPETRRPGAGRGLWTREAPFPSRDPGPRRDDAERGDAFADEALPSPNLAPDGALDTFEIDAALHLKLQREARAVGRRIVGLYHSHPASAPIPSPRDREGAYDHSLVWLIVGADGACRAWWPGPDGFCEAYLEVCP